MLQFTYIASALYLSSKSKPTNVKQLHQIRNLYQLWLNLISGFRPPLKAFLAWVALPVEFSDPHGLFQGWSFFGPLDSLHFPRENPSTPSTEEDGWPHGHHPLTSSPLTPWGSCSHPDCWGWRFFSTQGCPHTWEQWWEPQLSREYYGMPEEMNHIN